MEYRVLDPDVKNLNSILSNLESDLSSSYLHTRPKFDDDLLLQLQHSLNMVVSRESDLKACIGISKIILSSFSALEENFEVLKSERKTLEGSLVLQSEELAKYKDYEEKYYDVLAQLDKSELELSQMTSNYRQLIKEKSKKNAHMSYDSISMDRFSAEISDMTHKFKEEYDAVMKAHIETENKCKMLEKQVQRKSIKINELRKRIKEKTISTDIDSKVSRSSLQPSSSLKASIEDSSLRHSLKVSRESSSVYTISVAAISEGAKSDDSFEREGKKLMNSGILDISQGDQVEVKPSDSRKFTEELYFCMTFNVVKLNNPHLSNINITYPDLYSTAIQQDVPLHKWIFWIESQLNMLSLKNKSKVETRPKKIVN